MMLMVVVGGHVVQAAAVVVDDVVGEKGWKSCWTGPALDAARLKVVIDVAVVVLALKLTVVQPVLSVGDGWFSG